MKKIIVGILMILLLFESSAFGVAGTVAVTPYVLKSQNPRIVLITFACVGGTVGDAGTVPNTAMTQEQTGYVTGMFLHSVIADPGTTVAPDAASVFILNAASEDLLGSTDNATAINGLNLIHASLSRTTIPKTLVPNSIDTYYRPVVTGPLTLSVINQGTASADWTITLVFIDRP